MKDQGKAFQAITYKQNRAHPRHYRSEYVRGYLHRKRCVQPSRLVVVTIPHDIFIEPFFLCVPSDYSSFLYNARMYIIYISDDVQKISVFLAHQENCGGSHSKSWVSNNRTLS